MPFVSYIEWNQAGKIFRHFAMKQEHGQYLHFDTYTGVTYPTGWHHPSHMFKVREDELRRINDMFSPHAYTLFKIYASKKLP